MSKYHDDSTFATDAVDLRIDDRKLRRFHPELYGLQSWFGRIPFGPLRMRAKELRIMLAEHMQIGDSRAALVCRVSPLIVAAYSSDLDAVVLLQFSSELASRYRLKVRDRLLTVNTYLRGEAIARDLTEGPEASGQWVNYYPIIAEFVSSDDELINRRKASIEPAEWARTESMALALMSQPKSLFRDGRPLRSMYPATPFA